MVGADGWTSAELLAAAQDSGFAQATQRLIVDWTVRGLLDQPTRRPTGRGSALAVRSDDQRQLFLELLKKRREGTRIAALCNIPVFGWLSAGEHVVPIRQVRRAMRTFACLNRGFSMTKSRHTANEYLDVLGITNAPKRVRDQLAAVFISLGAQPVTELGTRRDDLAGALLAAVAPPDQRLELPYIVAALDALDIRLRAAAPFRNRTDADTFPDDTFHNAWVQYQLSAPGYIIEEASRPQSRLAELVNGACVHLLHLLGTQLPKVEDTAT